VSGASGKRWRQVHPYFENAYVLSFRSPDLLTNDPDERWGRADARLVSGGILTDFPRWLEDHSRAIRAARERDRPIILSLHVHSGYGTGLVTYSTDLQYAEVANYPWLIRELIATGLGEADVSVTVDTCNAQAVAAHQLRRDLVPGGVEGWSAFRQWRARHPQRRKLSLYEAYLLFSQDRVAAHLARPGKGKRDNVAAVGLRPLERWERNAFRGRLYGNRGVIYATPALFNLLRLGPDPRNTLTEDLLTGRLERRVLDGLLSRNTAEFRRFTEFAYLQEAAVRGRGAVRRTPAPQDPRPRRSRLQRVER
jgi:hypothetical protein